MKLMVSKRIGPRLLGWLIKTASSVLSVIFFHLVFSWSWTMAIVSIILFNAAWLIIELLYKRYPPFR